MVFGTASPQRGAVIEEESKDSESALVASDLWSVKSIICIGPS